MTTAALMPDAEYALMQSDYSAWVAYSAPRYLDSWLAIGADDKRLMFGWMKGQFRDAFLRLLAQRLTDAMGDDKRAMWASAGDEVRAALRELATQQKETT